MIENGWTGMSVADVDVFLTMMFQSTHDKEIVPMSRLATSLITIRRGTPIFSRVAEPKSGTRRRTDRNSVT